ncbi:MAG: hypothetical protein U5L06_06255 [Rhodovibrio sp.]|nr:hypothetical protein [Rhodovibrio sp.]
MPVQSGAAGSGVGLPRAPRDDLDQLTEQGGGMFAADPVADLVQAVRRSRRSGRRGSTRISSSVDILRAASAPIAVRRHLAKIGLHGLAVVSPRHQAAETEVDRHRSVGPRRQFVGEPLHRDRLAHAELAQQRQNAVLRV